MKLSVSSKKKSVVSLIRMVFDLGYGTHMQFVLNLLSSIVSAFAASCGVALSDRMPRRQVLVWGTLASALFLGINGGLSLKWAHTSPEHVNLAVGQG